MSSPETKNMTKDPAVGVQRPCSAWFRQKPTKKGYYWVYEIGNPEDVPQVLFWDGHIFKTHFKFDRLLSYDEKWSCAGPIRPPKIPKQNAEPIDRPS